jgi:16S rRNA (guanine966-N2)-methyltransferase
MRIITGSARGKKLVTLEGVDVRPTPDRVKEALFNILQFGIEGRSFLDLFAGSGQIGLEAISRGAESTVFVDMSKKSVSVIEQNVSSTGFGSKSKVVNADSVMYIKRTSEKFDVAFLDPPYRSGLLQEALPFTAEAMNPGGIIICEHPRDEELPECAGDFCKLKEYRYGKIILTSYRRKDAGNEE